MSRITPRGQDAPRTPPPRNRKPKIVRGNTRQNADPGEFEKTTSPVRERMAREIKETSPEERIRRGR